MENILIINLPTDRWEELKKIRIQGLVAENLSFARTPDEEEKRTDEEWQKRCTLRIDSDLREWLVIELDKKVIGCIMISIGELTRVKHVGYIHGMYILGDLQGKGFGTKLLTEGLTKLKSRGAIKVRLEVVSENKPAVALYEKLGFKIIGTFEKELHINDSYYDEYIMEKFL